MFKVRERSVSVGRNWTDWFCEFIILILLGTMHAMEVESSLFSLLYKCRSFLVFLTRTFQEF